MPYKFEFEKLNNPYITPSFKHHWALNETGNTTSLTDRVSDVTGTMSAAASGRLAGLASISQQYGLYAGYHPVSGIIVNEPIILAENPGETCTSDELTVALYVLTSIPFTDAILSISNRVNQRAWELGGGTAGGHANQCYEVRFSQDGTTVNKRYRTVDNWIGNLPQANFPAGCRWQHVAFTYSTENEEVKFYVNGDSVELTEFDTGGSWGIYNSNSPLILGNHESGALGDQNPQGVADVRIYNSVLTPSEIKPLANRYGDYIDPTVDTYFGPIYEGEDLQPAMQLCVDYIGNTVGHATSHRTREIKIPHGEWEFSESVIFPNGADWQHGTIAGVGSGDPSDNLTTVIRRSTSWTGTSQALFEVRGQNVTFEDITASGIYNGVSPTGIGFHNTRGPVVTGTASSGMIVRRCSGLGLTALHVAGWDGNNENNCDFQQNIECSISLCNYLFLNTNDQGQMQYIERPIGAPLQALVYAKRGGPIYIHRFGSAGTKPVLLIGSVGAQQAHYTLDTFKFDAQADTDCKIVEMLEEGRAHINVSRGFITNGERGALGENFLLRGASFMTVRDVVGPGYTLGYSGTQTNQIPLVIYEGCKWCWGPDGSQSFANSAANRVDTDPSILMSGDGNVVLNNCLVGTRYTQGSITPNPKRINDYRNGRPINVTIISNYSGV